MKIQREQLKAMIKECLIEILEEGIGGQSLSESKRSVKQSVQSSPSRARRTGLDNITHSSQPLARPALQAAVKAEAGGNKVLEAILADTAMNTLPKMMNESNALVAPGREEQLVAEHAPEEIFGEKAVAAWEALAFMPKRPMPQ